jgi:hypothetical protein
MSASMKLPKPYRLRKWRLGPPSAPLWFYTCARPGRTGDSRSKTLLVADALVRSWVLRILELGQRIAIVSLLGSKPDGTSEFSFYSFRSGSARAGDRQDCLSFQQWLDREYRESRIEVREHPTCDFAAIPPETLEAISRDIAELLTMERTVIVIDSGGETRTNKVCRHISAVEDSSSHWNQRSPAGMRRATTRES